ncbi:MAG: RagB/SusD protein [Gemmatimonadetes bacterium]|jgi:hypothetical protein|nr:RagB/SusD protein [Gemmatimonadota bacterium]
MPRTRRTRLITSLRLLCAAAVLAALPACNADKILTEQPKSVIVPDNLYVDVAGFEAGLSALYAQVRRIRGGQDAGSVNGLYATATSIGVDNGYGNQVAPTENLFQIFGTFNTSLNDFHNITWTLMYQIINQANTIINRADNPAVQWTTADKARVVGEARLMRAWAYRYLSYYFGDVPVVLEESNGSNIRTDFDRTPRDSVRKLVINDLLFAEANLPLTSTNNGKVTKGVAQHFLAEMYLATGQPALAEAKAQAVVGSGVYKLITARYGVEANQPGVAFMDQFKDGNANRSQGNTEALWVFQYARDVVGGGISIMRRSWVSRYETIPGMKLAFEDGGRGIGRNAITKWALNLYEPSDVRGGIYAIRKFYILNNSANLPAGKKLGDTTFTIAVKETINDRFWPSTRKWDWSDPANPAIDPQYNDQAYLRLAETYLLLAEAQFKQGNLTAAATNINIVRARAGASAITPAQVTLDFILEERSRELVTEEERRFTLLRTGTWYTRTRLYNPLPQVAGSVSQIALRDTVFPIPQPVIDANLTKKMPQNPGY